MLAHRSGMMAYRWAMRVLLGDFASHAEALTGQLKEASEDWRGALPARSAICRRARQARSRLREWLARSMDAARMGYIQRDNCFTWLERPGRGR